MSYSPGRFPVPKQVHNEVAPLFNDAVHERNLQQAKVYYESFLMSRFPKMVETLYANAMPHDILYVREYDEKGRFQFERRVIDPVEMEYIIENKPKEHWRLEQFGANNELIMQMIERLLGKPKQSIDVKTETNINIDAKKQADQVLDGYLSNIRTVRAVPVDNDK